MKNYKLRLKIANLLSIAVIATAGMLPVAHAATAPPESAVLLDTSKADQEFKSEGATATIAGENGAQVLRASFPGGKGWPAVSFPVPADGWDLSKYAGVQVDVTNTGAGSVNVALRVDNAGDWKKGPWNTEGVQLAAGATKTIKVTFGKSYGGNPGYALDSSKVVAIKIFADNPKQDTTVEVKNLKAFGTGTPSTVAPKAEAPAAGGLSAAKTGSLFDFSKAEADAFETQGGTTVKIVEVGGAKVVEGAFPAGNGYPALDFPAPAGGWNLSGATGVQAEVTNTGASNLKIALRVDNPGDWKKNPWNTEAVQVPAGQTKTIKVAFGKSYGGNPGYPLDPSKVSNIKIFTENPKDGGTIQVKSLMSYGTQAPVATSGSATPATVIAQSTAGAVTGNVFDIAKADPAAFKTQGEATVQIVDEGGAKVVQAQFPAGNGYPALDFPPPAGGSWNLATSTGVQVEVTNKGTSKLNVALRADNAGDWKKQPWNTESVWLSPGDTKTIKVTFGKSYGGNPGYALDASKITTLKVFAVNPKDGGTIQLKNLATFGAATAAASTTSSPAATVTPVSNGPAGTVAPAIDGVLLKFDEKGLEGFKTNQSTVSLTTQDGAPALQMNFTKGDQAYPNVQLPIPAGNWNLSAFGSILAQVHNPGKDSVRLFMRADNPGNWKESPWNTQIQIIPAGETKTLKLVFGENNGAPGYPLDAARISAMQFFLEKPKGDTTVILKDLRAAGSPQMGSSPLSTPADREKPVTPPDWLGKRPPVEGNWVQTLNQNFDGPALDETVWRTTTWWNGLLAGQTQRYSKDNLIFEDGVLKMKTEKRRGHQNDDPALPEMDYTTGHIITYDKWTQLYGYFEARVKLPTARGLWPAFWMMPDRGPAAGPEGWKRESTSNGGMEIDILEHLTEWGPGRNNVAVHWDGYDKNHQAWGTANVYFGPTPDGWHTFGLLWEPGKLTWYIDGVKKAEYANERVGSIPAYLLLNVQMGGWATKDVDLAKLPDYYQIDWVRAWQLKDRVKP